MNVTCKGGILPIAFEKIEPPGMLKNVKCIPLWENPNKYLTAVVKWIKKRKEEKEMSDAIGVVAILVVGILLLTSISKR